MWMLIGGLVLGALDGEAPRPELKAVEDKVRKLLETELGGLLRERQAAVYVARLAAPIARAPADRRGRLLEDLPDALQFHRRSMQGLEHFIDLPGLGKFEMPKEDLAEGLAVELDYLVARVERAAGRKPDPPGRAAIVAQIDVLMKAGVAAVAERLGGGAVPAATKKAFDGLAQAWKESLDLPYNCSLDRVLSKEELAEVVAGMKAEAAKTDVDETLLIPALREAAYRAVQHCFKDFAPFEQKSKDWGEKRRKRYEAWLKAKGVEFK